MNCMSRSTFGIVIGILNIVCYVTVSIAFIVFLVQFNAAASSNQELSFDEDDVLHSLLKLHGDLMYQIEMKNASLSYFRALLSVIIVGYLTMIPISALLIMGIVKKRHTLMAPWLILSAVCFIMNCISDVRNPVQPFRSIVYRCLDALIVYTIYTLYKDMRTQSNERPDQVVTATGVGYSVQTPHYSAVPAKA